MWLAYAHTGDPALQAAYMLMGRYNSRGHYIQAWGSLDSSREQRGRAIIDTMMNPDLLFWASRENGADALRSVALEHARTVLAREVRPDWSTAHVADFDPETGAFLKQDTHQGLTPSSCWSRG